MVAAIEPLPNRQITYAELDMERVGRAVYGQSVTVATWVLPLMSIVVALSAFLAYLASPRNRWHYLRAFVTSAALLVTLMGLGAVFGKTLGDFLRNE